MKDKDKKASALNTQHICDVAGNREKPLSECVLQRIIPAIEAKSGNGILPLAGAETQIEAGTKLLVCGAGFDEHTLRVLWKESYFFVYAEDLRMGTLHFLPDEWYEFTLAALPSKQKEFMQSHLDAQCTECLESSRVWREIHQVCQREANFHPPLGAVQMACDLFLSPRRLEWLPQTAEFARLVLDSFRQLIPATTRGQGASGRRLVHETESFVIDLRMEDDAPRKRLRLTGQILNSGEPGKRAENAQVVLFRDDCFVAETAGNAFGEFDIELARQKGLNLFIDIRGYKAIGIRLPD